MKIKWTNGLDKIVSVKHGVNICLTWTVPTKQAMIVAFYSTHVTLIHLPMQYTGYVLDWLDFISVGLFSFATLAMLPYQSLASVISCNYN